MKCTLCKGSTMEFIRCQNCKAVLLHPSDYITADSEKERYLEHNNDVSDHRYQNFVNPITSRVLQDFSITSCGLDYGCGTGPAATAKFLEHSHKINLYDPYFVHHPVVLEETYDFIICCEVR